MKTIIEGRHIPFGLSKQVRRKDGNIYYFKFFLPFIYFCKWYNVMTDIFASSWVRIDVLVKYSQSKFSLKNGLVAVGRHEESE